LYSFKSLFNGTQQGRYRGGSKCCAAKAIEPSPFSQVGKGGSNGVGLIQNIFQGIQNLSKIGLIFSDVWFRFINDFSDAALAQLSQSN
jgi:hypothetical protein